MPRAGVYPIIIVRGACVRGYIPGYLIYGAACKSLIVWTLQFAFRQQRDCHLHTVEATGSIPVPPTTNKQRLSVFCGENSPLKSWQLHKSYTVRFAYGHYYPPLSGHQVQVRRSETAMPQGELLKLRWQDVTCPHAQHTFTTQKTERLAQCHYAVSCIQPQLTSTSPPPYVKRLRTAFRNHRIIQRFRNPTVDWSGWII